MDKGNFRVDLYCPFFALRPFRAGTIRRLKNMVRIILGIVAGFVTWSIIWVGSDQVLMSIWPDWYGAHQLAFEKAMFNKETFEPDRTILCMHLIRSVIVSIMSGFIAAVVAGESKRAPMVLGFILLLVGIMVQAMAWNYIPVWYHLLFLVLLIPMTILGGKMRASSDRMG